MSVKLTDLQTKGWHYKEIGLLFSVRITSYTGSTLLGIRSMTFKAYT